MISCVVSRDGHVERTDLDVGRASELVRTDPSVRAWLDVSSPTESDLETLARRFDLHELTMEDMHHRDQRPKVETFGGYHFVVIRPLSRDAAGDLTTHEVHAILGDRFLITLRYDPAYDLSESLRRWSGHSDPGEQARPGFLLYVLLDEIVDRYLELIEGFEDDADDLESLVFDEGGAVASTDVQSRLFRLKRDVVRFRRSVMPLRRVVDFFQEQPKVVTGPLSPYFRDLADHVVRCIELVDNVRDLLTALLEVRVAQVANRLNEVMKKLTSWAAIILVPTLIAGIYGMNFRHMPELGWRYGYPAALAAMAVGAGALYVIFKRRDWL